MARRTLGAFAVALSLSAPASAADIDALVQRLKAIGPEGSGNAEAVAAWKELSSLAPDDLPKLLATLDDASPTAANYLRSAIDAIAERTRDARHSLPAAALETFLRDTRHSGPARQPLAVEHRGMALGVAHRLGAGPRHNQLAESPDP